MKEVKTRLQQTNPDRVEAFEKGAAAFAKKIIANFKDYEFVSLLTIEHQSILSERHQTVHRREHEPGRHGRSPQLP